jgi:hypothetical protein
MEPEQETKEELNAEQIRCMRARAAYGCSVAWLAADFKVSPETISAALQRQADARDD